MWVKIEKRAEKSDIYFKNEDVTKVSIRLDEYAKDHDILACWELGLSLRGEDILFKYFNTKEEAEEWMRENIFIDENVGVDDNDEVFSELERLNKLILKLEGRGGCIEHDEEFGDPLELINDLKLALQREDHIDKYKLFAISEAFKMLKKEQDRITREELGR